MDRQATTAEHSTTPPCTCADCLRATFQADQRRAELAEILARLDHAEKLASEGDGDE
jgi:hypothetical protein